MRSHAIVIVRIVFQSSAQMCLAQNNDVILTRAIPGSGERIPVVGLGTAAVFDEDDETTRRKADAVVQALVKNGGRLIDTASTYGDAESVLGKIIATAGLRDKGFIATQLESAHP